MKHILYRIAHYTLLAIVLLSVRRSDAIAVITKIGFCEYLPPYQYVDKQGRPAGMHIDLLNRIAQNKNLDLEYIPYQNQVDAIDALQKGEVDAVLGIANALYIPGSVEYSDVLSSATVCLIAPIGRQSAETSTQSNMTLVAMEYANVTAQYLSKNNGFAYLVKSNQLEVIQAQRAGKVDMALGTRETLLWYLDEMKISDQYMIVANYVTTCDYYIALRPTDRYLKYTLNSGLSELLISGEYDSILADWVPDMASFRLARVMRTVFALAAVSAIVVGVYVFLDRRIRKALQVQVQFKTHELNDANLELHKRIQQAEAESTLRQNIIEYSPTAMLLIDTNQNIQHLNRSACSIAGIAQFETGLSAKCLPVFSDILDRCRDELPDIAGNFKPRTIAARDAQGVSRQYRYHVHPIMQFGMIESILLMADDVTAEEEEKQIAFEQKKNEALGTIIAGIAHEIKNPLTAIGASASVIESKGDSEAFRRAFSTHIPREIERINGLIRNLIDYARPTVSEKTRVSIAQVVRDICELTAPLMKKGRTQCILPEEDSLYVIGDRGKMEQALLNILLNAIESVKKRETQDSETHGISISAALQGDDIIIEVYDEGTGMTAEAVRRCTDPFYTTKIGGAGIGLAMAKQTVEETGGYLAIDSQENSYTRIRIHLPHARCDERNAHETTYPDH